MSEPSPTPSRFFPKLIGKIIGFLSSGAGVFGWKQFFQGSGNETQNDRIDCEGQGRSGCLTRSRIGIVIIGIVIPLIAAGGGALGWKQLFNPPPPKEEFHPPQNGDPNVTKILDALVKEYYPERPSPDESPAKPTDTPQSEKAK